MKLISLALIAAGLAAADSQEIAEGTSFDAEQPFADQLIAAGLAKEAEAPAPAKKERKVKARLLVDSAFGKVNEVVTLSASEAKVAADDGLVDTNAAAVAYAESIAA